MAAYLAAAAAIAELAAQMSQQENDKSLNAIDKAKQGINQAVGESKSNSGYTPTADQDPDAGATQGQRLKDVMAKAQSGDSQATTQGGGASPTTGLNEAVSADAKLNAGTGPAGSGSAGASGSTDFSSMPGGMGMGGGGGMGGMMGGGSGSPSTAAPAASTSSASSGSNVGQYTQLAGALANAYGSAQGGAPAAQLPQAGGGTYTPTAQGAMGAQGGGQSESLADLMRRYQQGQGAGLAG